jgi:hypothetical protein
VSVPEGDDDEGRRRIAELLEVTAIEVHLEPSLGRIGFYKPTSGHLQTIFDAVVGGNEVILAENAARTSGALQGNEAGSAGRGRTSPAGCRTSPARRNETLPPRHRRRHPPADPIHPARRAEKAALLVPRAARAAAIWLSRAAVGRVGLEPTTDGL